MNNMGNSQNNPSKKYPAKADLPVPATPTSKGKNNQMTITGKLSFYLNNRFISSIATIILILLTFLITSILVSLTAGLFFYYSIQKSEKIVLGVKSAGFELGDLNSTEAAIELHEYWNLKNNIVVSSGETNIVTQPMELGLYLDPILTVEKAYAIGRQGNFLERVKEIIDARYIGTDIQPVIIVNQELAREQLRILDPKFSKPAVEPELVYKNGTISSTKGQAGSTINIDESLQILEKGASSILFSGKFPIQLSSVAPSVIDLHDLEQDAQEIIQKTPILRFYDPILDEWIEKIIPPEVIAGWISVSKTGGIPQLSFNNARINEYLEQLNNGFAPGRFFDPTGLDRVIVDTWDGNQLKTIIIKHTPTTYIIQPGDTFLRIGWNLGIPYWRIINQNPDIDPENLYTGQEISIPSKDELLPLPVIENKRIIISIGKQRLWAYENGEQIAREVISTGIDRSPTQPGVFQVQTHVKNAYASVWDLTMPNFLGIYEAWPGFMNGIHGLPMLSNGQRLWANILGRPASYGCIILTLDAAKWLYNWAEDGVIVEIRP